MVARADGFCRQRSLDGHLLAQPQHAPCLHDRGVARPVHLAARRHRQEAKGGAEPRRRGRRGCRADRRGRSARARQARAQDAAIATRACRQRLGRAARSHLVRRHAGADEALRAAPPSVALRSHAGARGRPQGGDLLVLVRAVPALDHRLSRSPRHVSRCHQPSALRARPRLRRALLPADLADRQKEPQRQEQHADTHRGRRRFRLRHRLT